MTLDCPNIYLKYGDKGELVSELQRGLKKLGYYTTYQQGGQTLHYKVDGVYGQWTKEAVKQFQRATKHDPDGEFGPKTCPDFNSRLALVEQNILFDCENTSLSENRGSSGEKVKLLQQALQKLGYYIGYKVDGIFGPYTTAAVKQFQGDNGHSTDGWFGPKTCKTLTNAYANKVKAEEEKKVAQQTVASKPAADAVKTDPYAVDTSKNLFSEKDTNLHIDGIHLYATSITPNTGFHSGNWKTVALLNGKHEKWHGTPTPLEYTIETHMKASDFKKLRHEFFKMGRRVCNVVCPEIDSGNYLITPNWSYAKTKYRKVTFKLLEDF